MKNDTLKLTLIYKNTNVKLSNDMEDFMRDQAIEEIKDSPNDQVEKYVVARDIFSIERASRSTRDAYEREDVFSFSSFSEGDFHCIVEDIDTLVNEWVQKRFVTSESSN